MRGAVPGGRAGSLFRAGRALPEQDLPLHPAHDGRPGRSPELTQDTFLKAYQGLAGWQPDALFRTWLFRIASNTAMDSLRRRKVVQYIPLGEDMDFPDHGETPEAQLQRSEQYGILDTALTQLPHEYREILLLREVEEMSYSDIAQIGRAH